METEAPAAAAVVMPYDPDAEPWRTARELLEQFGDEAVDQVGYRSQELTAAGRPDEARAMLPLLRAVIALGRSRDPKAPLN